MKHQPIINRFRAQLCLRSIKFLVYLYRVNFRVPVVKPVFMPFSYFGGKRLNCKVVWSRFGAGVKNYIECFAGGAAILLGNPFFWFPSWNCREIINDEFGLLVNAFRAIKYGNPALLGALIKFCGGGSELELIAWHHEFIAQRFVLRDKLIRDPYYYNLAAAARWIWLTRNWIAAGAGDPALDTLDCKMPRARESGWYGGSPAAHLAFLKRRLEHVQIYCGGFDRAIKSFTQTEMFGITAYFFDPPYPTDISSRTYAYHEQTVPWKAAEQALELGKNLNNRVVFCGYGSIFGEMFEKAGWEAVPCRNTGGHGNQAKAGRGRRNSADEYMWFSPGCLKP